MAAERHSSTLPPAQPSYVFRGHVAQIHSVQIVRRNTRLVTGDADGWVVFWKLESKRPVAVWKAHDGAILGTAEWGLDKVATHGRDNSLKIWKLGATDEPSLSTVLPADSNNDSSSTIHRPPPWLLHSLAVNTLNFCPFSMCHEAPAADLPRTDTTRLASTTHGLPPPSTGLSDAILVAVPAPDDKQVDIHHLPSEKMVYRVPRLQAVDSGMVMAVKLFRHPSNRLMLAAGYEGGFTAVHILARASGLGPAHATDTMPEPVRTIYLSKPHSQPILSLDVSPDGKTFYTSSADAIVAAHRIPDPLNIENVETSSTGNLAHVNASSSSSSEVPPIEPPSIESAIVDSPSTPLTFSKQPIAPSASVSASAPLNSPSLLSASLHSAPLPAKVTSLGDPFVPVTKPESAFRVVQTKHAGQQSLRVRSDGRIFATAGWDSRIRVYSAKTLKELAVLKWHKEGVYAVDFAEVLEDEAHDISASGKSVGGGVREGDKGVEDQPSSNTDLVAQNQSGGGLLSRLQQQREEKMRRKHWIAAGAKDGKVSLWEIY